ncbi:polysaccharide biosynthesis protein [Leptolyngbya sp. Heron Island J]|uniref:lipopolysaccharide biosynthesis protein n=1 Tax=Leptolyngbya sp. Heron Island J TaxID=1385935 RepID=UPI0003B99CB1|nr:lipopolysaccharide biosynthesis protein [Leptolyngbya sp. Heron Island J]ESA32185.1 polysaccharide biosynthesis protein [Leptolyngbya sp. Heron Island J]
MAKSNRHFEMTALKANLTQRSLQSGLISVAAQPLKLGIGIGGTMVLARLLVPADFGLLAMVQPVLSIVDSLSNLGLETATVQRQEFNPEQASVIFWLSLKINALILGAMVLTAPLVAQFYGQPELTHMLLCLAIGVASLCLSFQHLSLLKRQMRFELLTAIELVALVTSTVVAIATAWLGLGYWALVLQLTALQVTKGIAYWLYCDWRPQRLANSAHCQQDLRSTLSYGLNLTGFRCISRVGMKMDRVLLGYVGGASSLGFYAMAYKWAYFPFWQIYYPLFDVAVSSLSRSLSEPERYRLYCRRGLLLIFAVCMPALACLFMTADDVTLLMLGEQWLEIVPMFRVLIVGVFVGCLYRVTKWIYVSAATTQRQLRWSLIHTPVMIAAIAIGVQWGAYGVAVGYTVAMCLLSYPAVVYCVRQSPITLGDFMGALWRPAIAAIFSAGLLYPVQIFMPTINLLLMRLLVTGLVYSLFYICIWLLLPGGYTQGKLFMSALLNKLQ